MMDDSSVSVDEFVPPPPAPVFEPSEAEFADPLAYIAKIRPIGEEYGIVKIKPPSSWQPPFAIDIHAFEFTPRVQRLNELAAASRVKLNFMDAIARFWHLQGMAIKIPLVDAKPLDLYLLYKIVERQKGFEHVCQRRAWPMIAVSLGYAAAQGNLLRSHYRRLILPYVLYTSGQALQHAKAASGTGPGTTRVPLRRSGRPTSRCEGDNKRSGRENGNADDAAACGNNENDDLKNNNNNDNNKSFNSSECSNGNCAEADSVKPEPNNAAAEESKNGGRGPRVRRRAAMQARSTFLAAAASTKSPKTTPPKLLPTTTTSTTDGITPKQESCDGNFSDCDDGADGKSKREMRRLMFYGAGPKLAGMPEFLSETRQDIKEALASGGITNENSRSNNNNNINSAGEPCCSVCNGTDCPDRLLACDTCDEVYHMHCLFPPLTGGVPPKGSWKCPQCITEEVTKPPEEYGFEQAQATYTLASFGEMADQFKADYFNMPCHMVPCCQVEKEFWRLISAPEEAVTVEYGADLQVCEYGSGFPRDADGGPSEAGSTAPPPPPLAAEDEAYAHSPWNLNNLPVLKNSMLNHIASDISGMKIPWVYVGMCFSTFCWHTEDHWSYSINYLHWGEPKTWYGVPGAQAPQFESAMTDIAPELFKAHPDIMHHLVTTNNPQQLLAAGVKISTLNQAAGEFVVTFPRAYHAGFNQGYNFAEAVNFCPADWLHMGRACVDHYAALNRFCVFAHDELVCRMAAVADTLDVSVTICLYADMVAMVERERVMRKQLLAAGVKKAGQEKFELIADDDRQCRRCKTTCYLSALTCQNCPGRVVCLNHISELCDCGDPSAFVLRYRYTMDELPRLLQAVKTRSESYDKWLRAVKDAIAAPPTEKRSLDDLKRLLDDASRQCLPRCDTLDTLVSTIRHAERCTLLAKQLVAQKIRTRSATTNTNNNNANYANKLRLSEVESFHRQVANLACVIPEADDIKAFIDRVKQFSNDVAQALSPSPPCKTMRETGDVVVIVSSDEDEAKDEAKPRPIGLARPPTTTLAHLEQLLDTAISFDLQLEELPRLRAAIEQNKWVTRVLAHFPQLAANKQHDNDSCNTRNNNSASSNINNNNNNNITAGNESMTDAAEDTKELVSLYDPPSSAPDGPGPSAIPPTQNKLSLSQLRELIELGRFLCATAAAAQNNSSKHNKNNNNNNNKYHRATKCNDDGYLLGTIQTHLSLLDALATAVVSREAEAERLLNALYDEAPPDWDTMDAQLDAVASFVDDTKSLDACIANTINNSNNFPLSDETKAAVASGAYSQTMSSCIQHGVATPHQDVLHALFERISAWRSRVSALSKSGACLSRLEDLIAESDEIGVASSSATTTPANDDNNNFSDGPLPLLQPVTDDVDTVIASLKHFYTKASSVFFSDTKDAYSADTADNLSVDENLVIEVLSPRVNVAAMLEWTKAGKYPPLIHATGAIDTAPGPASKKPGTDLSEQLQCSSAAANLMRLQSCEQLSFHVDASARSEVDAIITLRQRNCDVFGPCTAAADVSKTASPASTIDALCCCCEQQPCDPTTVVTGKARRKTTSSTTTCLPSLKRLPTSAVVLCELCHACYHVTCAAENRFGHVAVATTAALPGSTTVPSTVAAATTPVKYWLCGHCARSSRPSFADIQSLDPVLRQADSCFVALLEKIHATKANWLQRNQLVAPKLEQPDTVPVTVDIEASVGPVLFERILLDSFTGRITSWQTELRAFLTSCRQCPWSQLPSDALDAKLDATDALLIRGLLLETHLPTAAVLLSIRNKFKPERHPQATAAIQAYEAIRVDASTSTSTTTTKRHDVSSNPTNRPTALSSGRGRKPTRPGRGALTNRNNKIGSLKSDARSLVTSRRRSIQPQKKQGAADEKEGDSGAADDDGAAPKKAPRTEKEKSVEKKPTKPAAKATRKTTKSTRKTSTQADQESGDAGDEKTTTTGEEDVCSALRCLEPIGDEVDWVQCEAADCGRWYHILCVGLSPDAVAAIDEYVCYECCPVDDNGPTPPPQPPQSTTTVLPPPPPICELADELPTRSPHTTLGGTDNKFLATVI